MVGNTEGVSRVVSSGLTIGLILSYMVASFFTEFGVFPVGLNLFSSAPHSWPGAAAGWAGVVLAIASCFVRGRKTYFGLAGSALVVLAVSLVLFGLDWRASAFTLLTAIPFAAVFVLGLVRLLLLVNRKAESGAACDRGTR